MHVSATFGGISSAERSERLSNMDEVPSGNTFDLLPSDGASLYSDNTASLKSVPVALNDSLDDGTGNGLDDSLDLSNENAAEVAK